MQIQNFKRPMAKMEPDEFSRTAYLNSIEAMEDENKGQSFDKLDAEEAEEAREYQLMKQCESLNENRMHIVKFYV